MSRRSAESDIVASDVERIRACLVTGEYRLTGARWTETARAHLPPLLACAEALEEIADGLTPCRECGRVHEPSDHGTTWADPNDGHAYSPLPARDHARDTLARLAEVNR